MPRMPYFFLYTEARNDAKLRSLTADQFRVWFRLLCYAAEQPERGTIQGVDWFTLAVEVADANEELLTETVARLERLKIVVTSRDMTRDTRDIARDTRDACDKGAQDSRKMGLGHDSAGSSEAGAPTRIEFASFAKRNPVNPSDAPERTRERKAKSRAAKGCGDSKAIRENPAAIMSRDVTTNVTNCHECHDSRGEEIRREEKDKNPPLPPLAKIDRVIVSEIDPNDLPFVSPSDHPPTLPMPGAALGLGPIGANSAADVKRVIDECARVYPTEGIAHWARQWLVDYPASQVIDAILIAADRGVSNPGRYIAGILKNPPRSPSKASASLGTSNLSRMTPERRQELINRLPAM